MLKTEESSRSLIKVKIFFFLNKVLDSVVCLSAVQARRADVPARLAVAGAGAGSWRSTLRSFLLYLGLAAVALGLTLVALGSGSWGFQAAPLRRVGPVLCMAGLALVILYLIILTATSCPKTCNSHNHNLQHN